MTLPSDWTIVESGLIELATTKLVIRYNAGRHAPFEVQWDGKTQGACGSLNGAKEHALTILNDLLCMGIEP